VRVIHQLVLGLSLVVPSGALLLYIFAWSTLSGGEFEDGSAEWWRAVLGTMFRPRATHTPLANTASIGFAAGALFWIHGGLSMILRELRKPEGQR
jgi:hypothetical protein